MTFVHPLLLGGLLLVGVPVLIHLMMRQKPKRLRFPALRFLQQRYLTNSRRLRLRHLLLLALRISLIALLCLALARPKLFSERFHLSADQPVAAILVFDTSYSMEYSIAGQTRLAEAQARADELLRELPAESRVAVLDSSELVEEWQPSIALAREKVAGLQLLHARPHLRRANTAITRLIDQAYRMFDKLSQEEGGDTIPKTLYIFSDRTRASWDASEVRNLTQPEGVQAIYLDVGVDTPRDVEIVDVGLPEQAVNPGDRIEIPVTVRATGGDGAAREIEVDFRIQGEPNRERKAVTVRPGESAVVKFERRAASRPGAPEQVPGLSQGLHQVEVQLGTNDLLPFDNARYGTFLIRQGRRVLILADRADDAAFWQFDLDYLKWFQSDVKEVSQVGAWGLAEFDAYDLVCLINVARPTESSLWRKLREYVRKGHGLIIVPGGEGWSPDLQAYDDELAHKALLPAGLERPLAVDKAASGVLWSTELPRHPLFERFRAWSQLDNVDFMRPERQPRAVHYWQVQPNPDGGDDGSPAGQVLLTYANPEHHPALLERKCGRGRVLLFTTAFDGSRDEYEREWNNYAQSSFSRVLINLAASYLAGDVDKLTLNYPAGQVVSVVVPPSNRALKYTLLPPQLVGSDMLLERTRDQQVLEIDQAVTPGNYSVYDGEARQEIAKFSINARPEEADLSRADAEEIQKLLGPRAIVPIAQSSNLREVLQSQLPQPVELFFWLMVLVLFVLAVESLLANRFYRQPSQEALTAGARQSLVPAPSSKSEAADALAPASGS
jgi:hypothetical protein